MNLSHGQVNYTILLISSHDKFQLIWNGVCVSGLKTISIFLFWYILCHASCPYFGYRLVISFTFIIVTRVGFKVWKISWEKQDEWKIDKNLILRKSYCHHLFSLFITLIKIFVWKRVFDTVLKLIDVIGEQMIFRDGYHFGFTSSH